MIDFVKSNIYVYAARLHKFKSNFLQQQQPKIDCIGFHAVVNTVRLCSLQWFDVHCNLQYPIN